MFFRAGYIESWGRDIEKILTAFQEVGLPEPVFEESFGGVMVTFLKDIYTEEYLRTLDINERQIKAVLYIKKYGKINNTKYQELNDVSKPTAARELKDLLEKKIVINTGTRGSSSEYVP